MNRVAARILGLLVIDDDGPARLVKHFRLEFELDAEDCDLRSRKGFLDTGGHRR